MDILETLIQLRDDLKTWVTNNLVALNAKIDSKTFPIDDELNLESINPVQNKVIAAKLEEVESAIGNTSGSSITDDGSGEFNIADPQGNVIFKVDADGIHTTDITANGEDLSIADPNGNVIFKADKDGIHTTDITSNSNNFIIEDASNNIIFQIDADGAQTTKLKLNSGDIDEQLEDIRANMGQSGFSGDYNELINKPNITDDWSSEFNIADPSGNVIFKVDKDGVHTTNINTSGEDFNIADADGNVVLKVNANGLKTVKVNANSIEIDDKNVTTIIDEKIATIVDSAPEELNTLNKLAGALGNDSNFANTIAQQIDSKVSSTDLAKIATTGEYRDLNNAPSINEDKPEELNIVDSYGNIIAKIDANGIKTTTINAKDIKVNDENVKTILDTKVDKEEGKGLSESNFTSAEKTKLSKIEEGANKIVVDEELSENSTNPVQNKVINAAIENLKNITIPVASSDTLGGVKVGGGLTINDEVLSVDLVNELTSEATNKALTAAQGKALKDAIDAINENAGEMGKGDMMKAIYDVDGDGIVDNAAQLEGHSASYFAVAGNVLPTSGGTVKGQLKIQSGDVIGAIIIGADVKATTLTAGTRHVGCMALPLNEDINKTMLILAADTTGDNTSTIGHTTGNFNRIEFGGRLGAVDATAPDSMAFTLAKTHNATAQENKVYALEMKATEARFNIPLRATQFLAPTNVDKKEQPTVKFMTSNGGSVTFGKEGVNNGTMIRLDQADNICRLRIRSSNTAGAVVWEQPETGAALFIDLGLKGDDYHRIGFPTKAGTLALDTVASTTEKGLMSAADKVKLNSINITEINNKINNKANAIHTHKYMDLLSKPSLIAFDDGAGKVSLVFDIFEMEEVNG